MRCQILCILLLASLMLAVRALPEPQAQPSPPFLGTTLPDPPRQNAPWEPRNSDLPTALESAAKTLFDQGLADPRGCEYREISVGTGSVWSGDGGVVKVHGWVLPTAAGETQPFAVCWNGLVYPVVSVGDKADLAADAAVLVKVKSPGGFERATAERFSLSEKSLTPLKACLLLRLGETDLAKQVWAAQEANPPEKDPYLRLASDWAWAMFDRAITAHMRGDDELSVLSARRLTTLQPLIEAEAARRGFEHPRFYDNSPHPIPNPYLSFLDPLPAILADEEERVNEPKPILALTIAPDKFPSKAARIAALIQNLNQVAARQWGQPGGVSLGGDPIVQALVGEGDAAVEPLIHDLATDKRLTRSISFGRDFFQDRHTLSAADAAFAAISGILHTSSFGQSPYQTPTRAALAAFIQTYWNRYQGLPLTERWYRTLADDSAIPEQWLQAATEIARPGDETVEGSWLITPTRTHGIVPAMKGESLRRKHVPTVAALMAKRIPQIAAFSDSAARNPEMQARDAMQMALRLADWDAAAAVPSLRAQFDLSRQMAAHSNYMMLDQYFAQELALLTIARVKGHDPAALGEYLRWLNGASLEKLPWSDLSSIFEPLYRFPTDPAVLSGAERLFNSPQSVWCPLLQTHADSQPSMDWGISSLLESPLLGLEPFRRPALAMLDNKAVAGTLTVDDKGGMTMDVKSLSDLGPDDDAVDPLRPKAAQTIPIRWCDVYARHLSQLDGMPRFALYWPEAARNAAIAETADRLRRYGINFQWQDGLSYLWEDFPNPKAHLTFPRLDHPAAPAEVQNATAIFSLAGTGKTRLWRMPEWPMKARWVADKRYPRKNQYGDGSTQIEYQQDGVVYQAEEVQQNGKWQRFFGFVGPHDIARVPAEEIEFRWDNDYRWSHLSGPLDNQALLTDGAAQHKVGAPLRVTLKLRNRTGLDQILPTTLGRRITLKLSYAPPVAGTGSFLAENSRTWTDLPPRPKAAFAPSSAPKALTPTQEITALRLDLRDWFDLQRPGSYRLQFIFNDKRSGLGDGQSQQIMFDLGN